MSLAAWALMAVWVAIGSTALGAIAGYWMPVVGRSRRASVWAGIIFFDAIVGGLVAAVGFIALAVWTVSLVA